MMPADQMSGGVFRYSFTVPQDAIDQNGHVNNVVYIQWMQEAAMRHSRSSGGDAAASAVEGLWVVRSHRIDYLSSAFAGDLIEASTWVVSFQKVRSLRRYRFVRRTDAKLLAEGETEWVFVNKHGRPCAIPESVRACFVVSP